MRLRGWRVEGVHSLAEAGQYLYNKHVDRPWMGYLFELSSEPLSRPIVEVQYCTRTRQMNVLTSRRVWIPLEFCADCNIVSSWS